MATAKKTVAAPKTALRTIELMDAKSVRLVKRARKLMRKLKKRAIKTTHNDALMHAEKLVEIFDTMLVDQKAARAAKDK